MEKIILFYRYTHIEDPEAIRAWQKELCSELGLRGRVLVAHEGINATLGGPEESMNAYIDAMRAYTPFADIDFKESDGSREHFPRLQVLARPHIVNLGVDPHQAPLTDRGQHLSPDEAHRIMQHQNDKTIIFDARNAFESRIGHFKQAHTPDIDHFRDLPEYIQEHKELFQDKDVIMYCTGGIRCERASALLARQGIARNVYQLSGGIHRYVEQYPNGFFRGKNYVFDGRISVRITDDVLTTCDICGTSCDIYTNCIYAPCNKHMIACTECQRRYQNTCSSACYSAIHTYTDRQRDIIQARE